VVSLFGPLKIKRPYDHCGHCGSGDVPWDKQLRLSPRQLTPAAEELAALAGTLEPFEEASQTSLRRMAGLQLSESTVERVTEEAGKRVAALLDDGYAIGDGGSWSWRRDAEGHTCAYVSLDAVAVPQQGPNAAAADWRMAWVGTVYNPKNEAETGRAAWHQASYVASIRELSAFRLLLRREATAVGFDQAQQQIAISDGGSGLEPLFRELFPRAEVIVDFWHAREHLVKLAAELFSSDDAQRKAWIKARSHQLRHEGGAAVLAVLEAMDLTHSGSTARAAHAEHSGYFRNHVHKMDYPTYRAKGWQIGSGPVESACKTVVTRRLKQSGMRWGVAGSDALCHLRALYRSGRQRWESFWATCPP
jgi:hypothetical protein